MTRARCGCRQSEGMLCSIALHRCLAPTPASWAHTAAAHGIAARYKQTAAGNACLSHVHQPRHWPDREPVPSNLPCPCLPSPRVGHHSMLHVQPTCPSSEAALTRGSLEVIACRCCLQKRSCQRVGERSCRQCRRCSRQRRLRSRGRSCTKWGTLRRPIRECTAVPTQQG